LILSFSVIVHNRGSRIDFRTTTDSIGEFTFPGGLGPNVVVYEKTMTIQ